MSSSKYDPATVQPDTVSAKPRVLIFHPALVPYRIDLFNALDSVCSLRIVFLLDNLLDQKLDQAALRGALIPECTHLQRGLTVRGRKIRFGYGREIRAFQPDIVITPEFGSATLAVALRNRPPGREFTHVIWSDDNAESIRLDPAVKNVLRKLLLPCAAGLIAVSEEAADLYRGTFEFKGHIGSVPILRNEASFRLQLQGAKEAAVSLAQMHTLLDTRVLVYVGRLAPEKGLDWLLDAFAEIVDQMPDARLVLVGDGPERADLENVARSRKISNRTIFAGHAEGATLLGWYRLGHVLALPSRLERFGAVVNEALLAGLPVVCSRYAGARVLIREPTDGMVVDPRQPSALRDAILHYLASAAVLTLDGIEQERCSRMRIAFSDSVHSFDALLRAVWHPSPA